jgi:hypothetical protein
MQCHTSSQISAGGHPKKKPKKTKKTKPRYKIKKNQKSSNEPLQKWIKKKKFPKTKIFSSSKNPYPPIQQFFDKHLKMLFVIYLKKK